MLHDIIRAKYHNDDGLVSYKLFSYTNPKGIIEFSALDVSKTFSCLMNVELGFLVL